MSAGSFNGGDELYGKASRSNYADEDDAEVDDEDDEFGLNYDEGLCLDDFGNVWEGMLEKQGKALLNKAWRPRWCSIRGPRFEYFEDHTKRKSLGTVPLELATWELASATSVLTVRTLGRDEKSGEKSGRAFYFRFLGDSDRAGFFQALRRAAYLRHREMLLEACRVGDAFVVHQVLHQMRVLENEEHSSSYRMAVCQPIAFTPDYDPSGAGATDGNSVQDEAAAEATALGTPGLSRPTLLDSILREASSSTQQSCLHLAVLSGDLLPWGDSKAANHLAQQMHAVHQHAAGSSAHAPPNIPLSALKGHGPHPVATMRLLLSPLPSADLADCTFLLRAPGQAPRFATPPAALQASLPLLHDQSRFLLDVVDGAGDTPLAAALKAQPFREAHLGKDSADSGASAQHAALRSSSRNGGASLYEIDPFSILGVPPATSETGGAGAAGNNLNSLPSSKSMLSLSSASSSNVLAPTRAVKTLNRSALLSSTGAPVMLDFGTGGLACALTLLSVGSRPATLNDHGCSPLHVAAAAPEHLAALRALLEVNEGADVNAQDAAGCSPLMHAAMTNNGPGAEALLALGADLDARSWKNGYTALAWAARCGSDAVSMLLLDEDRRLLVLQSAPHRLNHNAAGAPPLPVSSAAANSWLFTGAQVTWRGADQDLPSGTVGAVEVVHSDGDVEVLFATPSGPKTFTFKADRLAPASESANSNEGWTSNLSLDDNRQKSSRGSPRVPLVQVADSRGDLPIHLLARAYVAKSRESSRLKNAALAQFTSLLTALLTELPLDTASSSSSQGTGGGGDIDEEGSDNDHQEGQMKEGVGVNAKGHDGRTPLLILSRAEAEPANLDLVGSTASLLLAHGASVHATTSGGHTPLHLAADVGNHTLCRALVEKGADPNAQSMEGMTPYGYVRKRLASPPSGGATNGSGNGTGGSNANNSGDSLAMSRMLQRTSEVLLELGAYKMERSALAIEQDSVTAQWMKGADGSHQLRAATAPKLVAYLVKPTTSYDDVVSFTLQFHRTLRDDKDPFLALAVFLQLLKQSYDSAGVISAEGTSAVAGAAGSGDNGVSNSSGAAAVAVRVGVWSVLNCVLEMRLNLFPDPTASPADGHSGSGGAGANAAERESDDEEQEEEEGSENSSNRGQDATPEQRNAVRRALRDLVATTVRSGLPDALAGGSKANVKKGATIQPKLDSVYRYAKLAADAGDPIWAAFLSRDPLLPCAMLLASPPVSPAAGHGTYRAVLQLATAALAPTSSACAAGIAAQTAGGAGGASGASGAGGAGAPRGLPQLLQLAAPTTAEVEKGLLGFTPQQLASHITLLTHALFCAIPVSEFGDKRYGKGPDKSPRFHALKDLVLRLQYVCISEIVCRTELKTRAASVALLVRAAEACLQCNNFDGAVLLVGVLCDASIHRLRKTWDAAEALIPKHWEAVQHAVGMAGRSLEAAMAELTSDPPCMPAVGFIIKNLVNLEERPEFVEGSTSSSGASGASRASTSGEVAGGEAMGSGSAPPPPPPSMPSLVNFDRIRRIGSVFDVVTTSQRVPYPFGDQLHPTLLALLLSPPLYGDEEATYDQSRRVEAKSKPKKNSGS